MGQSHEYYIAEISSLSAWRAADLHGARVWCPLNSFNVPSSARAERGTILALQGAGDLIFLTSFIAQLGGVSHVSITTYDKFAPLLDNWPGVVRILPYTGGPAELDIRRLSHGHEYSIHHPNAVKPMMMQAMRAGWDHYDWMGLCLGVKPVTKRGFLPTLEHDTRVARSSVLEMPRESSLIAIHLTASMPERSHSDLLSALLSIELPDDHWHFVLLGGKESAGVQNLPGRVTSLAGRLSYLQTYELLGMMQAVIAVDSVVLHMANLYHKLPILALYGATPPTWAGPRSDQCDVMYSPGATSRIPPSDVATWLRGRLSPHATLDKSTNKGG